MSDFPFSFNKKVLQNDHELIQLIREYLIQNVHDNISLKKDTIKFLEKVTNILSNGEHSNFYELILESDINEILLDKLKLYISVDDVELFGAFLSFLIISTDDSSKMCDFFSKTDLPYIVMELAIKVCQQNFKLKLPKSITVDSIIVQIILVIHNMARNDQCQQCFIEQDNFDNFKKCIRQFINCKIKRTCILTMSVFIWLAKDDGKDQFFLDLHSDIINNFIEYIGKGIKTKCRCYEGIFVWELLLALQALSNMNMIKHSNFLTQKFINIIINILKSKDSPSREIEISLGILWNLSFTDNDREKLKTEYKIEDAIRNLTHNQNEKIQEKALGFLWQLSQEPGKEICKKPTKYDIFVSYCHAQNVVVKKLVAELKKKFTVWIDTEGIKGSGLDDMAKGIEQSKVLMMAVSPSYKQSQCCHSEASWAYRLKKPIIPLLAQHKYKPDGWLGMMICSETYVDVSNIDNLTDALRSIEEHILHKCNNIGTINISVTVVNEIKGDEARNTQTMKALEDAGGVNNKAVKDWSADEVKKWFKDNNIADLEPLFADLDGKLLCAMKKMMIDDRHYYNNHLEKELELSFRQKLKLNAAMEDLNI